MRNLNHIHNLCTHSKLRRSFSLFLVFSEIAKYHKNLPNEKKIIIIRRKAAALLVYTMEIEYRIWRKLLDENLRSAMNINNARNPLFLFSIDIYVYIYICYKERINITTRDDGYNTNLISISRNIFTWVIHRKY